MLVLHICCPHNTDLVSSSNQEGPDHAVGCWFTSSLRCRSESCPVSDGTSVHADDAVWPLASVDANQCRIGNRPACADRCVLASTTLVCPASFFYFLRVLVVLVSHTCSLAYDANVHGPIATSRGDLAAEPSQVRPPQCLKWEFTPGGDVAALPVIAAGLNV